MHRSLLVKESWLFVYSVVFVVDLRDRQLGGISEIGLLGGIFQLVLIAGTNGRYHVIDGQIGHAAHVVTLIGITAYEKTDDLGVEIWGREPHAIALLIAQEGACPLGGAGVGCGPVEWRYVVDRAPGISGIKIGSTVGRGGAKLLDPYLQTAGACGVDVVDHHTYEWSKFCRRAAPVKSVSWSASFGSCYILCH